MKIITDDSVYVQKDDITYLDQTDLPIPESIFMKVFGNGIVIIDDSNRYEFVKFDAPEEIEFFKGLSWMINYNEVKDLSKEETIALAQSIVQEKNEIATKFNSMSEKEKKENMQMVQQCELLDFKMDSLRDIFWFKQGYIKIDLPEGIEYPVSFQNSENGVKKLIKSIFKKKRR